MSLLAIPCVWLSAMLFLLWKTHPIRPVREWDRRAWLMVVFAPLTVLWWVSQRLLWAYRIRTTIKPPKVARFAPATDSAPNSYSQWHRYQKHKTHDGDWFVWAEDGRPFEVCWVRSDSDSWHGQVRAMEPQILTFEGDPFECHEFRQITMWDVHNGTFTPYTPPELAVFNHVRGER